MVPRVEPASAAPVRDRKYYLNTVIFEVEDRRFLVPKLHFHKSTIFDKVDNADCVNPIQLTGVRKSDFVLVLRLIYPLKNEKQKLSQNEWISVLTLATEWKMLFLRRMALDYIRAGSIPPVERIICGRELILPEWLRSGYINLAERREPLSFDEFDIIGVESALKLSQRIRRYRNNSRGTTVLPSGLEKTPFLRTVEAVVSSDICSSPKGVDEIERLVLAEKYMVTEWIISAYADLARRKEDITAQEAVELELKVVANVCQIREQLSFLETGKRGWLASATMYSSGTGELVDDVFGEELKSVVTESEAFPIY